jgi:hypothetical protein
MPCACTYFFLRVYRLLVSRYRFSHVCVFQVQVSRRSRDRILDVCVSLVHVTYERISRAHVSRVLVFVSRVRVSRL